MSHPVGTDKWDRLPVLGEHPDFVKLYILALVEQFHLDLRHAIDMGWFQLWISRNHFMRVGWQGQQKKDYCAMHSATTTER